MPKPFTSNEREYIKKKLMEEAQNCLKLYGVRKTTVDELVKGQIFPKEHFIFFESKEILFYEVLCSFHDELQAELMGELKALKKPVSTEGLTELFFSLYKKVEGSFLYKLITYGELELLMRKLPPEIALTHAKKDDFIVEQLISMVPGINHKNIETISAALRAIFLSMLHKHEIGEDVFEDALRLMIRGVIMQMFDEEILQ